MDSADELVCLVDLIGQEGVVPSQESIERMILLAHERFMFARWLLAAMYEMERRLDLRTQDRRLSGAIVTIISGSEAAVLHHMMRPGP